MRKLFLCLFTFLLLGWYLVVGATEVTYQVGVYPDANWTDGQDAGINEWYWSQYGQYRNNGAFHQMEACRYDGDAAADVALVIRFGTLSPTIPANTTITSAKLQLYFEATRNGTTTKTLAAARLKKAWVEGTGSQLDGDEGLTGTVDWPAAVYGSVNWATAGALGAGDKYADESSLAIDGTTSVWKEWDITTMVQAWINGGDNYGVMLYEPTGSSSAGTKVFTTRNDATTTLRPKLVVTYSSGGTRHTSVTE